MTLTELKHLANKLQRESERQSSEELSEAARMIRMYLVDRHTPTEPPAQKHVPQPLDG